MRPSLQTALPCALLLLSFGLASVANAATLSPQPSLDARHQGLLKEYCAECHNEKKQKGKFRVDTLPLTIATLQDAERWQKVLNQLNSGEMPPEEEKQPSRESKTEFLDDLANVMVAARNALNDQKGEIILRRLNRREYRNTLRELLGVEINVSDLPADSATGTFDTVGSNLFMSANQFEQYQTLGREALEEAFAHHAAANVTKTFRYEAEESSKALAKLHTDRIEAAERAQQWADAVEKAAQRPENADTVAALRKAAKNNEEFRRSWNKIIGAPAPEDFGFKTVENNADKANGALSYKTPRGLGYRRPYYEYYLRQPALETGAYLTSDGEFSVMSVLVPFDFPPGEHVVRIRAAATPDAPPERRFLVFGINGYHAKALSTHEVKGTMEAPEIIEIPLTLTRKHNDHSERQIFIREKGPRDHYSLSQPFFNQATGRNGFGPEVAIWVDWIEVERLSRSGKPTPPGFAALNIPLDDKAPPIPPAELHAALERFCKEAFRHVPPAEGYVDRLQAIYEARRNEGEKHSAALKETLSAILASPKFLYLAEPAPDNRRRHLSDAELATRLSYFLWSAPPDAILQDLVQRGEMGKPEVLHAQTDRLLSDPRSKAFVSAFTHQWLGLDRLDFFEINRKIHPRFDQSVKIEARNEVYETFAHLVQHNASLTDLLKADYVVINGVLADFYGIEGIHGDAFRKVPLPHGSPRGGLLGMAAIHVMGGNGERTNPVERGAWVLRKLLNDPPPPAPANVPQIARLAGKVLTTRERIQAHQEDAQCASCHRKIDPIGFGLENFDAVGLWRTEDSYALSDANGKPDPKTKKSWTIEAAATLHKGPTFRDYFELRELIAARSDSFAHGFHKALVEYALGRPCGFSDAPLLEELFRKGTAQHFAVRSLIHSLVASKEFQTK
jgi:hypothetical protein